MFTVNELLPDAERPGPVLHLGGEVDTMAAESVVQAGVLLLDRTATDLTVDLRDVTFIDSSGLGALVGIRNHASRSGRTVRVTGPQPNVERAFRVTGLDRPFGLPPCD